MLRDVVNESSFAFTVTAANLNLSDTVDQVLYTFPENDRLIRVPTRLELWLDVDTAYTIANATLLPTETLVEYPDRVALSAQPRLSSYSDIFSGANQYLYFLLGRALESGSSAAPGTVFFAVPARGFLDASADQYRLAFPIVEGGVYQPGRTTAFLRSGVTLSVGTGVLKGRLYFREYATYLGD